MPAKTAGIARIEPPKALDRAGALLLTIVLHAGLLALLILLKTNSALVEQADKRLTLITPTAPKPPPPKPLPKKPVPAKVVQDAPKPKAPEAPQLPDLAAPAAVAPVVPVLTLPALAGDASAGTAAGDDGAAARGTGNGRGGRGEGGAGTGGGSMTLVSGRFVRMPAVTDFRPPPNMIPGKPKSGWAKILCRTGPKNRLVDCVTHSEYPVGSGFSEAMRVASRRFRYVAEDSKGEPVVGALVLVSLNFLEPARR